jgi:hypothetical protein
VSEGPLLRLVELVRRELGAKNARVEIGGDPPDDPAALWRDLSGAWRVVAVFGEPPVDREARLARLDALVSSFSGLAGSATILQRSSVHVPVAHTLSVALADLASRAGGTDAAVIDASSPVLWGTSDATRGPDEDARAALHVAALEERIRTAGADLALLLAAEEGTLGAELSKAGLGQGLTAGLGRELRTLRRRAGTRDRDAAGWRRYVLACRAIAMTRKLVAASAHPGHLRESVHEERFGLLARAFANIYILVIAFDGTFSELHAEAAMLHTLPRIEQLVLSLPPVPPSTGTPGGQAAQVVSLASRRRRRR